MRGRWLGILGWLSVGLVAVYVVSHAWLVYRFPEVLWPPSSDVGSVALLAATFAYVRFTARQVAADRAAIVRADLASLHDTLVNYGGVLNVAKAEHERIQWDDDTTVVSYSDLAEQFSARDDMIVKLLFSARERRPRIPAELRPKVTDFENAVMAANRAAATLVLCVTRVAQDAGSGTTTFLSVALENWASQQSAEPGEDVPLQDVTSGAVFDRAIEAWRDLRAAVEGALDLNMQHNS